MLEKSAQESLSLTSILTGSSSESYSDSNGLLPPLETPSIADHQLIKCIGRGSYGQIWLAQNVFGAYRAVKIVSRASFDSERPYQRELDGLKKFEPVSRLHESQVNVLHVGQGAGYFYYVMELADDAGATQNINEATGVRLPFENHPASRIEHPNDYVPHTLKLELQRRGHLPFEECVQFGLSLATALEHLHEHGLIHRDIKPSNIIFVSGRPKLADIGLVANAEATCSFVGTEGYLPPEGPGTIQADVYSLGKVLYEIATGKDRRQFPELPVECAIDMEEKALRELNSIVIKACSPDASLRYKSALEMRDDLLLLLAGKSVRRTHDLERRLKIARQVCVLTVLVLVLGIIPYTIAIREGRTARREAARARLAESQAWAEQARASGAERDAKEKLWNSYLAQARANRLSGQPGRRIRSLEILQKAAAIHPSLELRNEAIACLALSDMRIARDWQVSVEAGSTIQLDPSYQRYAKSDASGRITLYQTWDDKEIMSLKAAGTAGSASRMWFSPNGLFLAASYRGGEQPVLIWDLSKREAIIKPNTTSISAVAFSPDGQRVVIAHAHDLRNWLSIYDLGSALEVKRLSREWRPAHPAVAFNSAGDRLAVSYETPNVEIWDTKSWKIVDSLSILADVHGLAWHPNGNAIAVASADTFVYICDVTGKKTRSAFAGHRAQVVDVGFNHAGDLLYSVSWDGNLILWDLATSQIAFSLRGLASAVPFSLDDRWLACFPNDGHVGIWEIVTKPVCRILRVEPDSGRSSFGCAFSPNGQLLATCHRDGMRVWDTASAREIAFLDQGDIDAAIFDVSGRSIITSGDKGLKQWPVEPRRDGNASIKIGPGKMLGNWLEPEFASMDQGGESLSFIEHQRVHRFKMKEKMEEILLPQSIGFDFAALSPDGRMLAAAAETNDLVRIWANPNAQIVKDLRASHISRLCFSPDSKLLVTASTDKYTFWETSSWISNGSIPRQRAHIVKCGICFTQDGRMAAIPAPSADLIRLIDPVTLQEYATLESPLNAAITALCFSPDGTQLAASTHSRALQLWDLRLIRSQLAKMKLDWGSPSPIISAN